MLDDNKRTEAIKAFFTEREYLDICRQAVREDRKPGELVRVIVRRSMYGSIGGDLQEVHGAINAESGSPV